MLTLPCRGEALARDADQPPADSAMSPHAQLAARKVQQHQDWGRDCRYYCSTGLCHMVIGVFIYRFFAGLGLLHSSCLLLGVIDWLP